VRVLDFGLARPGGAAEGPRAAKRGARDLDLEHSLGDLVLTRVGTYVGTPAYMSPEQQLARAADARSDQFSFCVALHEAVFGVRPFAGSTQAELRDNVVRGRLSPPPQVPGVPERLRAVLLRGLALDPAARFPAMPELLAALRHDPSRQRRIALVGALVLGLSLLVGVLVVRPSGPDCERVADGLAGVWDEARRQELRGAFSATGVPFADETLVRVERGLDHFAAAWTGQAQAHCEAARRGDADREQCLERRRVELRALVDVFARADVATVEHASGAVERLRDPALCADPEALAAEQALAPLPANRALAAAVWTLRERLASVRFLELAGRFDEGLQRAGPLVDEARALGHPPVLAEALLLQAVLWARKAEYATADAGLLAAITEAERAGHHVVRAEAMVHRIEVAGSLQARPEAIVDWLDPSRALVRHVAPGGALEGRLLVNIGLMRYRQGDYLAAVASHEQAVALLGRVLKEGDPEFLGALVELGRSYWRSDDLPAARRTLERARELTERELGPDHPLLIGVYLNLGNVMGADEALYLRSLALSTRTFGPGHPSAGLALGNLGSVYLGHADFERALDAFSRAVAIQRRALGVHPLLAVNLSNLGSALGSLKRHDEALAVLRESVEIYDKLYPTGHPDAVIALINLGDTARRTGELVTSRDSLRRALALTERPGATGHRDYATIELADTLVRLGAAREALELLRPILERPPQAPPFDTRVAFVHAQALWLAEPAERPRAYTLARTVEATLVARLDDPATAGLLRENDVSELAEVRSWLSARPQSPKAP
jgi:tetratricopeptide (TPR) repeat protein